MEDKKPQKTKKEVYLEYLTANCYKPETPEDNLITFKRQGFHYLMATYEDDPQFFHLSIPDFAPAFHDDSELNTAIQIANWLTAKFKGAKVIVVDGDVHANLELFFGDPSEFVPIFERATDILASAVFEFRQHFKKALEEQQEDGDDDSPSNDHAHFEN